jgi:two-component system cell cycle sensor histidine kinase/response regulator CckA
MSHMRRSIQAVEINPVDSETVRVLLIDDNPGDARLVKEMLLEARTNGFRLEHASCIHEGLSFLSQERYQVILLDLSLPDGQGLDTIKKVCPAAPQVPIIILTGLDNESTAIRAVQEGAQDYLVKGQMNSTLLVRAIRYAIERKRTEEVLREEEDRFRQLFDDAPVGYHEIDSAERIVQVNHTELEMLGYGLDEMVGEPFWKFILEEEMAQKAFKANLFEKISPCRSCEWHYRKKDGSLLTVLSQDRFLRDPEGKTIGLRTTIQDITEWKRTLKEKEELEAQFRQSQKMEAIGRLAGGIAHDFNNILTTIKGYTQLSLLELKEVDPLKGNIEEIQKATDRATNLTRQILAFSRHQIMDMKVLDLNSIVEDLDKMLRRVIGEDIELVTRLAENLGRVKMDPGQIDQVIMNLAVNARDAMPEGGRLTIETVNVEFNEGATNMPLALKPGRYSLLSVNDTGVGIAPDVKEHIFEPFFTTKEKGKGTGLGLSTVYAIISQSGGDISVQSEQGQGTTFRIYLPQVDKPMVEGEAKPKKEKLPGGNETILLVEDAEDVRKLAARFLKGQGYTVLEAPCGGDALTLSQKYKEPIHMILTDVVLPGMDGRQLVQRCREIYQDLRVIYMSGYADREIIQQGISKNKTNYIQKPFTLDGLAKKVREVLNEN